MRSFWIIILGGLTMAGAIIGFTDLATEISYMGKILFYIAGIALIFHLLYKERRRRRRINRR